MTKKAGINIVMSWSVPRSDPYELSGVSWKMHLSQHRLTIPLSRKSLCGRWPFQFIPYTYIRSTLFMSHNSLTTMAPEDGPISVQLYAHLLTQEEQLENIRPPLIVLCRPFDRSYMTETLKALDGTAFESTDRYHSSAVYGRMGRNALGIRVTCTSTGSPSLRDFMSLNRMVVRVE